MSTLIVEISEILAVSKHPNADNLEIAKVKGWECIVKRGAFKTGDKCIYIPIDAVLPIALSEALGITQFLSKDRVKTVKLRGIFSQGLVIPLDYAPAGTPDIIGTDLREALGITKYEAPIPIHMSGEMAPEHPLFHKYTDIENLLNFPDVLKDGELVAITEKLHGTSFRAGYIDGEFMVGTRNTRRRETTPLDIYWTVSKLHNLPGITMQMPENTILYGEIYGKGIQKLWYGEQKPVVRFFDISINGKFLDFEGFMEFCEFFTLPTVPVLAEDLEWCDPAIKNLAEGESTLAGHVMEGIVIRPMVERYDNRVGRVVLKYINKGYLLKDYGDMH